MKSCLEFPKKRAFSLAAIFAFVAFCALFSMACVFEKRAEEDRVREGDTVPAFTVTSADGSSTRTFTQADFVGKRSMIVFFLTTCPDCRRELPIIYEAWLTLRERPDFEFVAISRAETADVVAGYWNSEMRGEAGDVIKPSFERMPYWLDPDASAFHAFAESYVPRIYLIDTNGKVAKMSVERFDLDADALIELVENLQ